VAQDFETKFRGLPQLVDVNSDLQITSPQLRVDIQRDRAATLGITPEQIEDALYSAFGTRQVSTIYTPTNQYYVIMEVAPEFQRDPASLSLHLPAFAERQTRAARCRGHAPPGRRPAHGQPPRPGAVGHPLVQPEAGRLAGRRHDGDRSTGAAGIAAHAQLQLRGLSAGLTRPQ
jgi:hypothetical protein